MCCGGIYDHVGGGFARYSTDEKWLVPPKVCVFVVAQEIFAFAVLHVFGLFADHVVLLFYSEKFPLGNG